MPERRITWLGHATVLIEAAGARLLTDPVLGRRVAHLRRHAGPAPDPGRVDAVLISHVHRDHLDRASLRAVAGPQTAALVPAGAAALLRGLPFGRVRGLRAGDEVSIGGVPVAAVPAWHPARRHPAAPVIPSLGFLTERIWFAGDTGLDDGLEALRGRVDVALVPIWGWGPSVGPGHLDPEGAARAVALVRPPIAIPIHWGTFLPIGLGRSHANLLTAPAEAFGDHAGRLASSTRVVPLTVGESLSL
jgi:L-ascorbate metabolism protein UlaG (beta-lactamase superfamily)